MKILVTGCAGFIGSHLCDRLLKLGHEVYGIDNISTGINHTPKGVKLFRVNLIELDRLQEMFLMCGMSTFDICYHLAAQGSVPHSIKRPAQFMKNNVQGFENLLLCLDQHLCDKVVFASSSSVYGDDQRVGKIEEYIGRPLSPYALTKQINEKQAEMYKRLFSLNYIGLRFFNVFGPRQRCEGEFAPVIAKWIKQFKNNGKIEIFGNTVRDYTYVDNVVDALLLAGVYARPLAWNRIYNIGGGKATYLLELAEELKKHFPNSSAKIEKKDKRAGDIHCSVADMTLAYHNLQYSPKIDVKQGVELLCAN